MEKAIISMLRDRGAVSMLSGELLKLDENFAWDVRETFFGDGQDLYLDVFNEGDEMIVELLGTDKGLSVRVPQIEHEGFGPIVFEYKHLEEPLFEKLAAFPIPGRE